MTFMSFSFFPETWLSFEFYNPLMYIFAYINGMLGKSQYLTTDVFKDIGVLQSR